MTVAEARDWLRLDNTDNDDIITSLLSGAVEYIELTTGLDATAQAESTLAQTVTKYLLSLWYDPTQTDTDRLQRTIDSLLKVITTQREVD